MNVVHVVPHIDKEASGPSYSVPRLCQSLARGGASVELICLAARGEIPGVTVSVHRQWPLLEHFAVSTSLARYLSQRAAQADIVHNHSLWSMSNVAAGLLVPGHKARLVTSPRGTLSTWALNRSRWSKRGLWPLQRRALTNAALLHATSDIEYEEIRALGLGAPVMVLPNGIDMPSELMPRLDTEERTLLFLSRIHPKKGIDRLLRAWQLLQDRHPDWRLVIAGRGDDAHVAEVTALAATLNLHRVHFPGAVYGLEKSRVYTEAQLFVLPTHSENFGLVVAEALAHGCPAVVGRGAPWSGLQTEGCGWWMDNDVDRLTGALDEAMSLPAERLVGMGARGRAWMERDFGWESIGKRMVAAYQWLLDGGDRPAWVRID